MSFFSGGRLKNLISHASNPKYHIQPIYDPGGATKSALDIGPTSAPIDDSQNYPMGPMGPGDLGGDMGDEEYGSFTKPFDVEEFYKYQDPGYGFRKQQGEQSVLNSASAGSGAQSGAALKDLLSFNQDLASTEYNNAFNRYQTQQGNIFSRLYSLLNLGQNAASNVGAQGTQLVGQAGQNVANAGAAAGAGIVGAGNSLGNGASDYWLYRNFGGH